MEIAKVTSKGQVTIPKDIREKLNLQCGDKILFMEEEERIYIYNAADDVIKVNQKAKK